MGHCLVKKGLLHDEHFKKMKWVNRLHGSMLFPVCFFVEDILTCQWRWQAAFPLILRASFTCCSFKKSIDTWKAMWLSALLCQPGSYRRWRGVKKHEVPCQLANSCVNFQLDSKTNVKMLHVKIFLGVFAGSLHYSSQYTICATCLNVP